MMILLIFNLSWQVDQFIPWTVLTCNGFLVDFISSCGCFILLYLWVVLISLLVFQNKIHSICLKGLFLLSKIQDLDMLFTSFYTKLGQENGALVKVNERFFSDHKLGFNCVILLKSLFPSCRRVIVTFFSCDLHRVAWSNHQCHF
jgi:hypothetical protein